MHIVEVVQQVIRELAQLVTPVQALFKPPAVIFNSPQLSCLGPNLPGNSGGFNINDCLWKDGANKNCLLCKDGFYE
jgi:hypothetical protein